MKLYIPTPGDRLKLTSDWTFTLYNDYHNWQFITAMGLPHVRTQQCTLSAGSTLKVKFWDTQGTRTHWDHVVFYLLRKKVELWVSLPAINLIDCDVRKPKRKPVYPPNECPFNHEHYESDWDDEDWDEDWNGDSSDDEDSDEDDLDGDWDDRDDSFPLALTQCTARKSH